MKKIILFICIFLLFSLIVIKNVIHEKDKDLTNIKVAEVTHSLFYTPFYVSLEKGYFKDNGLSIELILTPGADKTAASVLSNDTNIGLSGPEATIYVYNNGEKDNLKTFASLTKRDGQFLVGDCKYKDNFKVEDLNNKKVLAGRSGGMPLMIFNYALKDKNINVDIDKSIEFAGLSGAYISKQGDFVNLFEPNASLLEHNGYGCVLSSLGLLTGEVPYTTFYARTSYIEKNKDILASFVNALNKGLTYVRNNDPDTIANVVKNQFLDTNIDDITNIIKRYKESDSWYENTIIKEESFDRLQDIMIYNKALENKVKFDDLITNEFNNYIKNK